MSSSPEFKIAHITDIHLPADRASRVHDADTYDVLARMLSKIAEAKPDMVLVTGDISDDGGVEPYAALNQLLEPFPNTMVIPGNHDLCPGYSKYFEDAPYQVRKMNGWTFLALNTAELTISNDTISACQRIMEEEDRVFLATHHPLVTVGTPFFDEMFALEDRDERWRQLKPYPSLKAAVFGHIHFRHHSQEGHVQVIGTPAVSFEILGNPDDTEIEIRKRHGFQYLTLSDTVTAEPHYIEP